MRQARLDEYLVRRSRRNNTGLPRNCFDLVYCRFLLLHLPDPGSCLREMRDVLRPGGILVVEDGDLASATSVPPSATDAFADLFCRLGPTRGVDYSLARNLYHLVMGAGFADANLEIHQPAIIRGENRFFLKWSVEEAGPALVNAGITTPDELTRTLSEMQHAAEDPIAFSSWRPACPWSGHGNRLADRSAFVSDQCMKRCITHRFSKTAEFSLQKQRRHYSLNLERQPGAFLAARFSRTSRRGFS